MRIVVAAALMLIAAATVACGVLSGRGAAFFQQYEYEEEIYLALDATATVYVNASVPALDALRGWSLSTRPNSGADRAEVRRLFTSPITRVTKVTTSRRSNRVFVHVRLEVDDIRRLGEAAPFAWSRYEFQREGDEVEYRQRVGSTAGTAVGDVGWKGREVVAFRMHVPSKILYHNAGADNLRRGNILVWEQPLADRLNGVPLTLEARMEPRSILYTTLWLFGGTLVAVLAGFVLLIWWVRKNGAKGATVDAVRG